MVATNPTNRLILGHMPLIGISYQSKEKDEEYRKRFSEMNVIRNLMEAAIRIGVSKFATATPSSSSLSPLHLETLRRMVDEGHNIELFSCVEIPLKLEDGRINVFRRWATYLSLEGKLYPEVKRRIVNDPILNFREGWRHRLHASKPYEERDFLRLSIDWTQIEEALEYFVDFPVAYVEPGSETDFLTMADRFDLLGELVDRIKGRGFERVLLGIHHAGVSIPRLDDELGGFHGFVTPLNPLGVMMFPTKTSAEGAVRSTGKAVYAIKPLAGGRIEPRRAFHYVFDFDVDGCMMGVGSVAEMEEDFKVAVEVLSCFDRKSK